MSKDDKVVISVLMESFFHQFMAVANFMYPLFIMKNGDDECNFQMFLLEYLKDRLEEFHEKGEYD